MSYFSRVFNAVKGGKEERVKESAKKANLVDLYNLISSTKESLYDLPHQNTPTLLTNPDPVISRKGYEIYDTKMPGDPIISSLTEIAVIGMLPSWNIVPGGRHGEGRKGADFIRQELENMPGSVLDLFHDEMIEPTFRLGFTVGEAAWNITRSGEAHLVDYLYRPHNTIKFVRNAHGRVIGVVQETGEGTKEFPESRTVHLNYKGGRRNPYGRPGYFPIYDPWMDKVDWMTAWAVFLHRYGPGLAKAKVPEAKYEDKEQMTQLITILENIQGNNIGIFPEWLEIEFESTAGGAGALYSMAINQRNAEITRGLLGTDTAVAEAIRVGARADTEGKIETMWKILHVRGSKLREQITEQFFRPLIRWNMPGEPTPRLETEEASAFDVKNRLKAWRESFEKGFLPAPTVEQQIQLLIDMGVDVDEKLGITIQPPKKAPQEPLKAATKKSRALYMKQRKERLTAEDAGVEEVVGVYQDNAGPALIELTKTLFPNGKLRTHHNVKQANGEMKEVPLSTSWYRDNIQIKGKKALQDKLFEVAWASRKMGEDQASQSIKIKATSAIGTAAISDTTAQSILRNDLYYVIRDTYGVLEKEIWFELQQVLKGRTLERDAINNIRQILFSNRLSDPTGGVTTLVRTSLSTALNDGRDFVYSRHETLDPSTADSGTIIGYEVYATLDGVTTDECVALHGMCFMVGDPDMPYFPRDYNCRSDKFPIFGKEEPPSGHWLSDSERATVKSNPAGKGFGGARGLTRTWR